MRRWVKLVVLVGVLLFQFWPWYGWGQPTRELRSGDTACYGYTCGYNEYRRVVPWGMYYPNRMRRW